MHLRWRPNNKRYCTLVTGPTNDIFFSANKTELVFSVKIDYQTVQTMMVLACEQTKQNPTSINLHHSANTQHQKYTSNLLQLMWRECYYHLNILSFSPTLPKTEKNDTFPYSHATPILFSRQISSTFFLLSAKVDECRGDVFLFFLVQNGCDASYAASVD